MGTKPPAQVVARITGMSPRACSSPQGIYNRRHANEKRPNVGKLVRCVASCSYPVALALYTVTVVMTNHATASVAAAATV